MKSQDLREAEAMTIAVGVFSRKLLEAMRNGRPLSTLSPSDQLTCSWVLGAAEAITQERERTAKQLDKAHFVSGTLLEGMWERAAKEVHIASPGAMQVAVHIARAAVEALGLPPDDACAADVKTAIESLSEPYEPRAVWRGSLDDFVTDIRGLLTATQRRALAKKLDSDAKHSATAKKVVAAKKRGTR